MLLGCGSDLDSSGPRLRVTNEGSTAILQLTVILPDDRVYFGDMERPALTIPELQREPVAGFVGLTGPADGRAASSIPSRK